MSSEPAKPNHTRIPLKPETARMLLERNTEFVTIEKQAQQAVAIARQRLLDALSSIYTENGITSAEPVEITQAEPFELVLAQVRKG